MTVGAARELVFCQRSSRLHLLLGLALGAVAVAGVAYGFWVGVPAGLVCAVLCVHSATAVLSVWRDGEEVAIELRSLLLRRTTRSADVSLLSVELGGVYQAPVLLLRGGVGEVKVELHAYGLHRRAGPALRTALAGARWSAAALEALGGDPR